MSISTVQTLLNAHLEDLTGLPPTQLENTQNLAVTGEAFTRATLIPARSSVLSIGVDGRTELRGLYQVDLFVPLNSGTADVNALADLVVQHFPKGARLTDGSTTVHCALSWREVGRRVEAFYQVPVLVQWSSVV
jgi:hypothetical protein